MIRLATNGALAMAAALMLIGAGAQAGDPPRVVATISLIADMARAVAGESAAVIALVGADGDAHMFEPSPADLRQVADAQLVVSNGLGLDSWIDRLVASSGFRGLHIVATAGVPALARAGAHGHGDHHAADPHAWQSLANGQIYVANITRGLVEVDATKATVYRANAGAYVRKLVELDGWVRTALELVPTAKRKVITTHDAFEYYGQAYGVRFLAPVGISTGSEPLAGGFATLIRLMRREQVKALFIENISDPRLMQQLAREAGAVIGGKLYSDALSPSDGPAPSYIKMFEHNTTLLKSGMLAN